MEVTCTRCHQTILAENCYCPLCGLPQLVYPTDVTPGQTPPAHWEGADRDAGSVDWKPALRAAMLLAVPAGLLSSGVSPLVALGMLWMTAAGVWAVVLYMRSQRPAWITLGAGARIGLVTGLLAGWLAFGVSSLALFVQRFLLHQSSQMDAQWKNSADASYQTNLQMIQQWSSWLAAEDMAKLQASQAGFHAMMLTPEGKAGNVVLGLIFSSVFLLLFAVAGGAFGARLAGRTRQPEL
jgi:hypothetical protein